MGRIRIGVSGWHYDDWRDDFYPDDLPRKDELSYLAGRFETVEVNGTFYRLLTPPTFRSWYGAMPADFTFAVKGSRFITHNKKLLDATGPLANFFASGVLELDDKLGPILWQLPPGCGSTPNGSTSSSASFLTTPMPQWLWPGTTTIGSITSRSVRAGVVGFATSSRFATKAGCARRWSRSSAGTALRSPSPIRPGGPTPRRSRPTSSTCGCTDRASCTPAPMATSDSGTGPHGSSGGTKPIGPTTPTDQGTVRHHRGTGGTSTSTSTTTVAGMHRETHSPFPGSSILDLLIPTHPGARPRQPGRHRQPLHTADIAASDSGDRV